MKRDSSHSPKVGYIIIRGANETRQLASYSDSTRSKLDSSKLDSSSSSTRNVNASTRAQLNSNSTRIISTPREDYA